MIYMTIDNKQGSLWNISEIVADIQFKTSRIGRPGQLTFTLIKNALYQSRLFAYRNGDIVRFYYNQKPVFLGYIFKIDSGQDEDVKITCYDQIYYLTNTDTYVVKNITATELIRQIAEDFEVKLGTLDDTGYRIPAMSEDSKKLLDTIDKAITLTLINANRNYVLYDDFGALTLRNVEDMLLDFYIGDNSLMYGFSHQISIDNDTYNRIKLYKDNKETGNRELFMAQDSINIARWGLLQLYQSVDEDMNEAQINELLTTLSTIKNRERQSLKLDCIGDIRIRAGCYVPVIISEYDINQPFLVDECTHRFNGVDYTTQVQLKVI